MIWLTEEQLIYLHSEIIKATGGLDGIRDKKILLSALQAPMQTYDSQELFPSIFEKAARLACGLTQFHPFIDGNKRIGAHAMLVILELNGLHVTYTQKELSDIFLQIASGKSGYEELRDWLRTHSKNKNL